MVGNGERREKKTGGTGLYVSSSFSWISVVVYNLNCGLLCHFAFSPNTPASMFFSYNKSLGPPYRILVDTNFVNFSISSKLDVFESFMACLYAKCKWTVTQMITQMCSCMYTHVFISACMQVCINTYPFMHAHMHVHTHTHIYTHIHTHTHTHTHTCTHMYIHTYTHSLKHTLTEMFLCPKPTCMCDLW